MVGLVPKSGFLTWLRGGTFKTDVKYSDTEVENVMRKNRLMMYWGFSKPPTCTEEKEEGYGMTPRSSSEVIEDWILDLDMTDVRTPNEWEYSCYSIEQILITEEKTKLLLLVRERVN